MNYLFNSVTT